MPDRYGDPRLGDDDTPPEPLPTYGPTDTELRHQAITECTICDDDGYHGNIVCDHIDRTETAARGIDQIRRAMGWNTQPPQNQPENPPTGQPGTQTTPL